MKKKKVLQYENESLFFFLKKPDKSPGSGNKMQNRGAQTMGELFVLKAPLKSAKTLGVLTIHKFGGCKTV